MSAHPCHPLAAVAVAVLLGALPVRAQFGGLDKLLPKNTPKIPSIPSVPSVPSRGSGDISPTDVVEAVESVKEVVKGAGGVSAEDEQIIGATVASEIVAQYGGLDRDAAMTRRVALIGKTLGMYSGRPDLPWRFGVLNTDTVNGVSAPGGYVFVTRGLVNAVKNDDELAGVLAHEISHVVRRHALRIVSRGQMTKGLMSLGTQATAHAGGPDLRAYDDNIHEVTGVLLETGYDPGVEYDADRAGTQLAWETGYDPAALGAFLRRLAAQNPDQSYAFSHHPPLQHRIDRLASTK